MESGIQTQAVCFQSEPLPVGISVSLNIVGRPWYLLLAVAEEISVKFKKSPILTSYLRSLSNDPVSLYR